MCLCGKKHQMLDLFFGCLLVAFGPAMVFLLVVVVPHSHLAVLTIIAAFFQLIALLFTALIHYVGVLYLTVCLGVLFQHIARWAVVKVYFKIEKELLKMSGMQVLPWTEFASAVGSGYGFGLMNSLVLYGSVLAQSTGRADYFACNGKSPLSLFLLDALVALGMQIAHVAWMVLAFRGHRSTNRGLWVAFVLHMLAALCTVLNSQEQDAACTLGLPLQYVVVIVSVVLASRSL